MAFKIGNFSAILIVAQDYKHNYGRTMLKNSENWLQQQKQKKCNVHFWFYRLLKNIFLRIRVTKYTIRAYNNISPIQHKMALVKNHN